MNINRILNPLRVLLKHSALTAAVALIALSGTARATKIYSFTGGITNVSGYYPGPDNGQYNAGAEGFTPNVSGTWSGGLDTNYGPPLYFFNDTRFTLTADPGFKVKLLNFDFGQWNTGFDKSGFTVLDRNGVAIATVSNVISGTMADFGWPTIEDTQLTIVFTALRDDYSWINNITFSKETSAGAITAFGPGATVGFLVGNSSAITWAVPFGTNVTTLAPTFTLSSGACDKTSGGTYDFTSPVTYTVTDIATDPDTVNTYTVTVTVGPQPPGGVNSPALWLDASDASTMTLSGTTVNEWRDKLGSTAKMTRDNGAPTVVASGIGGIPTVHFTSGSSMRDGVNHSAPVTIFYVSRQTGGDNRRVLTGGNNWLLGYWSGRKGSAFFEGNVRLGGDGDGTSDTAPHLYATTIGGSGQNSTVWAEGVQIASNQGGTDGPNGLFLGGGGAYSEYSDCDISEVLVYHRILNPTELDAVGGYLTAKYGLTTSYPSLGYGTWASTSGAIGQTAEQDHDKDGVKNGIEYFMGETGSSFTTMPGLNENNMISWPAEDGYVGTYEVQTSPDLGTWNNVTPRPVPVGGNLSYTLPPGLGKQFVRLLVTPTP